MFHNNYLFNNYNDCIFNGDYIFLLMERESIYNELNDIPLPKPLSYNNNYGIFGKINIIKNNSLGRKRKNSKTKGLHNKYSQDNILRRIKSNILLSLSKYINAKIYNLYKGTIGKGTLEKKLKKLSQKKIFSN